MKAKYEYTHIIKNEEYDIFLSRFGYIELSSIQSVDKISDNYNYQELIKIEDKNEK